MCHAEEHGGESEAEPVALQLFRHQRLQKRAEEKFLSQRDHPKKTEKSAEPEQQEFPPFERLRAIVSEVYGVAEHRSHGEEVQIEARTCQPFARARHEDEANVFESPDR